MLCPRCGSDRDGTPLFCGACGMRMLKPCPLCLSENILENIYCDACGIEMDKVLPGIPYNNAIQARELFADMGWAEFPKTMTEAAKQLYNAKGLSPTYNAPEDYWLFYCIVQRSDWKIEEAVVNNNSIGRGSWAAIGATRCRLVALQGNPPTIWQWPFTSIVDASLNDKDVFVRFKSGDTLRFRVNAKGPRMLDIARHEYWSFSSNTAERYLAGSAVGTMRQAQQEFLGVVGAFLEVIASCGEA